MLKSFMEKEVHLLIMYTMLVLALLLFHKGRKHPRSLMLALYALVEVITNGLNTLSLSAGDHFFIRFPFLHFIYKPLYCLWVPLFYFYVRLCFYPDFKWKKRNLVHLLPFFTFQVLFLLIWIIKGNYYLWENLYKADSFLFNTAFAVDIVVKMQYLIYNFLMIRLLVLYKKDETSAPEMEARWLHFIVYGYALASLIAIGVFISNWVKSPATDMINLVSISYFFAFFFVLFYNTITNKLFTEEVKPKSPLLPHTDMELLMKRIDELVAGKQMYLEPELTLLQIATALNEKERNISQVINTLQHRNLNDYLNSLRIEHACRLLQADKGKPVFQVMYESGFNTKGTFNLAFKKIVGKTPTQFREG